jgi:alpha-D-xyloside xylohydrolase
MAFDYPADEQAWAADQHMMVGPDLLAVPVTADRDETDAAAGQPTPVDVYLPRGRWVDLYTGEVLNGGRHLVRESTLDDFPLYLRAGAAIGFNQRIDGVWPEPWGVNDLDRRDRAGWTYAPGPGTTVAANPFGGRLRAHSGGGKIHLTVTGAPAETQVMVAIPSTPRKVVIDGRPISQSLDSRVGWATRPAPFGGVLLKLNPRHGTSTQYTQHIAVDACRDDGEGALDLHGRNCIAREGFLSLGKEILPTQLPKYARADRV